VQLFANRGFTDIFADRQVDAQIGYTFPEGGRFADMGILLQIQNLTNSPYRTALGLDGTGPRTKTGGGYVDTFAKYGRQWILGFKHRF
jgi:iron complex outermembrane receptor protein